MTTVIPFVFGAIVGSFLNVVGLRFNSGLTLAGRSACSVCGKKLRWFELIPIFSFFLQGGRCRNCKTRISKQYPVIEILTGFLFLSIFSLQFTILNKIILILVFCIYIAITIYDWRHKIIPDSLVYAAIILSLIYALLNLQTYKFIDLLSGPILFLFFFLIWFVSKGVAMGFGDAKLGLSIGLLLGGGAGFSAVILAFWIGAVLGLLSLIGNRNITMKSEIPFAPFLVLGSWLSLVFGLDLLHVSLF